MYRETTPESRGNDLGSAGLSSGGGSRRCWGHAKPFTLADARGPPVTVLINKPREKMNDHVYENLKHL